MGVLAGLQTSDSICEDFVSGKYEMQFEDESVECNHELYLVSMLLWNPFIVLLSDHMCIVCRQ
jgi:hypothetical protein